jgi:hypothetical protein
MRGLTLDARGDSKTYREFKDTADITKFFEEQVKRHAFEKIERRAVKGHFTANIMEYGFYEYFYVKPEGGEIVRVPKFERIPGTFLHRIHTIVTGELFQKLLTEFVATLGDMRVSCWYPGRDLIDVITISWAPPVEKKSDADASKSLEDSASGIELMMPIKGSGAKESKPKKARKPAAAADTE